MPRKPLLLGMLVGVLLAVAAIAVLLTSGKLVVPARGADTAPITLPADLGGLRQHIDVYRERHTPAETAEEEGVTARTDALTASTYSRAYDGAAVAVHQYASDDLTLQVTIVAIRASSSPLLPGVLQDPTDLGLLALPTEVIEIGQARCLIRRFLHGPGGDLNPFNQATDECQRTGPGATVFAYVEGAESSTAQRQVVDATDAAFALIS